MKQNKGLTLIELLIVIGIIAVLAAIIYVAIDPVRRLEEARDAERWSSVNSILNAVLKYAVDNGELPPTGATIDNDWSTVQVLGTGGVSCTAVECSGQTVVDTNCFTTGLDDDLVDEYIGEIPVDPQYGTTQNTQYYINKTQNGRIVVGACQPERASSISVTR